MKKLVVLSVVIALISVTAFIVVKSATSVSNSRLTAYDELDSSIWGHISRIEYHNDAGYGITYSDEQSINKFKDILHRTKIKKAKRYEEYSGGSNCLIFTDDNMKYVISYAGEYITLNGTVYFKYMDKDTIEKFQSLFIDPFHK